MESQLQGLIEEIKEEGVNKAKEEASRIVEDARQAAAEVVGKAEKQAEELEKKTKSEIDRYRQSSEKAIQQSARNVILGLQNEIFQALNNVLKDKTADALSDKTMKELLVKITDNWLKSGRGAGAEVFINEKEKDKVAKMLISSLAEKVKKGLELKPVKNVKKGFLIGIKGGNVHYDITESGISEMLMEYLNPKLREIINSR
jgi:V/A-type H+-transporting ATPase subunit E